MSQSDNALYQALVARLETLTGEGVDVAGASNNRLLQYMLLLMNQLELGDGSGGPGTPGADGKSAYELAQDEGFTGTLSEWLESLVGPAGQGGERYDPSYQRTLSVNAPTAGVKLIRAIFVTSHARPDGADIRVFAADGQILPCYVYGVQGDAGGLKYSVAFQATLAANTNTVFDVRYGDPAAEFMHLTSSDLSTLIYAARHGEVWRGSLLSFGPDVAYLPADFETAGVQIFGNRDDLIESRPTPATLTFADQQVNPLYHGSNGWVVIAAGANGVQHGGGDSFINAGNNAFALSWGFGDLYEVWRREVLLSDGMAWHIRTGLSGYGGGIDLTVRYQNVGIWTLTMLHNQLSNDPVVAAAPRIAIGVGGEKRVLTSGNITRDAPGSALALRWGVVPELASVGAETIM